MIKNKATYEIMTPESIGLMRGESQSGAGIVLGKHSGRNAVGTRLVELGCVASSRPSAAAVCLFRGGVPSFVSSFFSSLVSLVYAPMRCAAASSLSLARVIVTGQSRRERAPRPPPRRDKMKQTKTTRDRRAWRPPPRYNLEPDKLNAVFTRFKIVAEKKKGGLEDEDLEALVNDAAYSDVMNWNLADLQVRARANTHVARGFRFVRFTRSSEREIVVARAWLVMVGAVAIPRRRRRRTNFLVRRSFFVVRADGCVLCGCRWSSASA